jgi:hypothetical protein
MDIGAILIGLAALILVVFLVSQPLLNWRQRREETLSEADRLRDERDRILTTLRDLDFDHASGKVVEEDYAPLRASLVAEGAAVLKQLDELKPAGDAPLEDQLEQAIAAHRHKAGAGSAPAESAAYADEAERAIAARRRRPAPVAAPDADEVEQAIAARRRRSRPAAGGGGKVYCSQCGQAALPGDKFCAKCGAKLLGALSTKDSA